MRYVEIEDLELMVHDAFFAPELEQKLAAELPWINRDGAPRDECFMSMNNRPYTYGRGRGVRTYHPVPFTEHANSVRAAVGLLTSTNFDVCFANRYIDHRQHLGWHADDSDSIDHSYGIAVVSFGAAREIWFRKKFGGRVDRLLLTPGSVLLMPAGMQQTHEHRIPKHSAVCGQRISLTFRRLLRPKT
jgi:alkylated DNA repair dioxygenase AlkB